MTSESLDKDEPVKRYTQMGSGMVSTFHGDQSQPAGDWVKASDYDALREEVRSNITAASALRGWPYGMSLHDFCEAVTEIPAPLPELRTLEYAPLPTTTMFANGNNAEEDCAAAHAELDAAGVGARGSFDSGKTWQEYSLAHRIHIVCGANVMMQRQSEERDEEAATLSTSGTIPPALDAAMLELDDFLNNPPQYEDQLRVRDYRHEAYPKWSSVVKAVRAAFVSARPFIEEKK